MGERIGKEVQGDQALLSRARDLWGTSAYHEWRDHMRRDVEETLRPPPVEDYTRRGVSQPGWGLHNFDLALVRWKREHHPSAELLAQVENWRSGIEARGLEALEPWG